MPQHDEKSVTAKMEPEKAKKAPYSAPRLTVYGKVNHLTLGGGGMGTDPGGMTMA